MAVAEQAAQISCHSDRSTHAEAAEGRHEEDSQQGRSQGNSQGGIHSAEAEAAEAADPSFGSRHSPEPSARAVAGSHGVLSEREAAGSHDP